MPETFSIACSACPRKYDMSVATLATRKNCTFCGAPLIIPPEAAAAAAADTQRKVGANTRVSVECLLCTRVIQVQGDHFGRRTTCQYCTCPMIVTADGHVAPVEAPEETAISQQFIQHLSCSACRMKKLAIVKKAQAKCGSCGAENDLSSLPLESLIALQPRAAQPLMTSLVFEALQTRWRMGQLALAEAAAIVDEINIADAWTPEPGHLPFPPLLACDILQYAILGSPSAQIEKNKNGCSLLYLLKGAGGAAGMMSEMALKGGAAVAMAGAGYIVVPRPGAKKEQAATADPAIIVELTDSGDGSTYVLYVRNTMDEIGVAPDNIRKQWEPMIDQKFRMAACRYVTFRALFGGWANGAMLYGSTQKALEKRLVSLGGTLKARAGELSQALVPQTMKK